ncbi:MAG: glycosyltransferase family 2 protein [Flavobacteriia bacterium]|jgi:glycosyltransferase involved in cell wall biosynthesis
MHQTRPQISVVIPLLNEVESLPSLHEWLLQVFKNNGFSYEVVFVDDGSDDGSWKMIESLCDADPNTFGVKFQRNYGKSAAMQVGFQHVKGDVVITMDADLQDSPDEIPELYKMIVEDGFDLVSGWKQKRYDPLSKTLPTKLYNWAARRITGIHLHDFNCGLKAYRLPVVKSIEVYGDMHRYMPALAKYAGFKKIGEKVVQHQARKFGVTKFGLNRFLNGPLDLMTVAFMGKFGKKPMHFFGALGTLMFIVGFGFGFFLGIDKLFIHTNGIKLAQRTEFFVSLTAMLMGLQFFLTGFIAELMGRNASSRNNYLIEEKSGWD